MKKATIADVAEKAGVSKATVSRYLKQENVRKEIAERVQAAIEETGYIAKGATKSSPVAETKAVVKEQPKTKKVEKAKNYKFAILSRDVTKPAVGRIVQELGKEIHNAGCLYQLYDTQGKSELEEKYLTACIVQNVNAVLVESCSSSEFIQKQMRTTSIPVIYLHDEGDNLHTFAFDEVEAGRLLGNYILNHRHHLMIRYLGMDEQLCMERLSGVKEAYHDKNQPVDIVSTICDGSYSDMFEKIKEIFAQNIDLLILEQDDMAMPLHKYLREYHIAVPQNVSVVSFGGSEITQVTSPIMANVHYDYVAYAQGLFAYACSLIEGGSTTKADGYISFAEGDSIR